MREDELADLRAEQEQDRYDDWIAEQEAQGVEFVKQGPFLYPKTVNDCDAD